MPASIPVAVADPASRADVERPRVFQEAVGVARQATNLFRCEATVPALQVAGGLVVEIVAGRRPGGRAGVVGDACAAQGQIGEQVGGLVDVEGQQAIPIEVALLGLHGPARNTLPP
ncbi:hypothetical protein G6F63_014902 [Rhizopus arrhizus]|nr:hypothetical protein G6F63_014902 [Rhizopus arrhizus]